MAVVKFGGTGHEVIKAKAGQNILPALGVECLCWIRVITKKPEGLTIIASTSATHYTTKKNDEYGIYEAEKKAVCTSMGAGTHGTITSVAFDEDVEAVVYFQG